MEKIFDPSSIEKKWYQHWEQSGQFTPKETAKNNYCIMIPPPNVTGSLHMGHAFQDTIMDLLIRYQRMLGNNTLWQVGTDHAGIATQMVVERQLEQQGLSRHDLGRDNFVSKVWEWKEQSGSTITNQLRRMGASVDWEHECFTMDENLSKAVRKVFIDLYREGLIYRGKRLVNWDPVLHTALSDLEVIATEKQGSLWYIDYPVKDSPEKITIATTRPETMLGDVAIAVNPDDSRYKNLIGKTALLPLTNREIPIIADSYVAQEFGTGAVKITPAHDFNDFDIGKRHQLELINIFTKDAKLNSQVPAKYQGLDRFVAREQIIKDLQELNLLVKIVDHDLKIPVGDRSHAVIEPYLTDQWYVKVAPLAQEAILKVKNKEINFVPENWSKVYFNWMENIEDWCISRQLWWGHRIPAYYDKSGNIYVGEDESSIRQYYKLPQDLELFQDEDVLDTWFSSALWPFATLGWPENTNRFKTFYPTNVLVTGFDIIFFWVARMIMFGIKFTGKVPFNTVYIHGLIQDHQGQKMSKSKGNIIDPLDLIDGISLEDLLQKRTEGLMQPHLANKIINQTKKQFPQGIPAYGTDALRFTFCSLATTGRHLKFELARIESYRNFCNKLWNASRYVLLQLEGCSFQLTSSNNYKHNINRWIWSKWQNVKSLIHGYIDKYRFDLAAKALYEFTWDEYCDWYLELSKQLLLDSETNTADLLETKLTLILVLEELLRALHPIMPFITEEIWQRLRAFIPEMQGLLIAQEYPQVNTVLVDTNLEDDVNWLKQFIITIRTVRAEVNIAPKKELAIMIAGATENVIAKINKYKDFINKLAKIVTIDYIDDSAKIPPAAMSVFADLKIFIPIKGLIDLEAEKSRLSKNLLKLEKEVARSEKKLTNQSYVVKAPKEVVAKEKEALDVNKAAIAKIQLNLELLNANLN